ncbi:MAG: hypothetical protein PHN72_00290 [Bacilli bacterium]|nr:hypothetical protein [Bacilli bacterium]
MEYEVRYYYPKTELPNIVEKLKAFTELQESERCYEKTTQFDHPCTEMSFYNKEIDGRFRIRVTKSPSIFQSKISWKRRLPSTSEASVNKEEEIELAIQYEEYDSLLFLINNVLKMKEIESYERYRITFSNQDIEIAVDEYPFGIALEIENKITTKNPEQVVTEWVNRLGLDINKSYKLSWDDKYTELCKNQNIQKFSHVSFDLPMPEVLE